MLFVFYYSLPVAVLTCSLAGFAEAGRTRNARSLLATVAIMLGEREERLASRRCCSASRKSSC